jgi:hypothetical protein
MDAKLYGIIKKYIYDYLEQIENDKVRKNRGEEEIVVKNSIPIVWFGDMEEFIKTKNFNDKRKRVITIAANPSNQEFPIGNRRFDIVKLDDFYNLDSLEQSKRIDALAKTWNNYFNFNPYMGWFNSYESILNGFNASYFTKNWNQYVTIHIDLYSAVATNPTWSNLKTEQRKQLSKNELIENLLEYLDPDIVLYSSDQKGFNDLKMFFKSLNFNFQFVREYCKDKILSKSNSVVLQINNSLLNSNYLRVYKDEKNDRFIFWGKNISKPFTVFNASARTEIIKSELKGRSADISIQYK